MPLMFRCSLCRHAFDPGDPRGIVNKGETEQSCCPACTITRVRSIEAWAVYNDCQGVFTDEIRSRRSAAIELMHSDPAYAQAGCRVVPVIVVVEDEHPQIYRKIMEDEQETSHADH